MERQPTQGLFQTCAKYSRDRIQNHSSSTRMNYLLKVSFGDCHNTAQPFLDLRDLCIFRLQPRLLLVKKLELHDKHWWKHHRSFSSSQLPSFANSFSKVTATCWVGACYLQYKALSVYYVQSLLSMLRNICHSHLKISKTLQRTYQRKPLQHLEISVNYWTMWICWLKVWLLNEPEDRVYVEKLHLLARFGGMASCIPLKRPYSDAIAEMAVTQGCLVWRPSSKLGFENFLSAGWRFGIVYFFFFFVRKYVFHITVI